MSLPKATVDRVIKSTIVKNGTKTLVSSEVKKAIHGHCMKFIAHIAEESQRKAEVRKKKTIGIDFVLQTLDEMGFEFRERLERFNDEYEKKNNAKKEKRRMKKMKLKNMDIDAMKAEQKRMFEEAKKRHQSNNNNNNNFQINSQMAERSSNNVVFNGFGEIRNNDMKDMEGRSLLFDTIYVPLTVSGFKFGLPVN